MYIVLINVTKYITYLRICVTHVFDKPFTTFKLTSGNATKRRDIYKEVQFPSQLQVYQKHSHHIGCHHHPFQHY